MNAEGMPDDLAPLVKALQRKTNHLDDRITELEDDVALLYEITDIDPGSIEYDSMSRSQKVRSLRLAVLRRALTRDGKAKMTYREVMTLFNDHPSAGHCYDLMRDAASLAGFEYADTGPGDHAVRVDVSAVNDTTLVQTANNELSV